MVAKNETVLSLRGRRKRPKQSENRKESKAKRMGWFAFEPLSHKDRKERKAPLSVLDFNGSIDK
jgi:hypothetical protein